jgi:hypothetical protein
MREAESRDCYLLGLLFDPEAGFTTSFEIAEKFYQLQGVIHQNIELFSFRVVRFDGI